MPEAAARLGILLPILPLKTQTYWEFLVYPGEFAMPAMSQETPPPKNLSQISPLFWMNHRNDPECLKNPGYPEISGESTSLGWGCNHAQN